jgi:hypothetical protein
MERAEALSNLCIIGHEGYVKATGIARRRCVPLTHCTARLNGDWMRRGEQSGDPRTLLPTRVPHIMPGLLHAIARGVCLRSLLRPSRPPAPPVFL